MQGYKHLYLHVYAEGNSPFLCHKHGDRDHKIGIDHVDVNENSLACKHGKHAHASFSESRPGFTTNCL